jgi:hypothetical protein
VDVVLVVLGRVRAGLAEQEKRPLARERMLHRSLRGFFCGK